MKIKTSDLIGTALDWAVSQLEKPQLSQALSNTTSLRHGGAYAPSTDWAQGGPILARERISLRPDLWEKGGCRAFIDRGGSQRQVDTSAYAPTPLIAAMRCYVLNKLGAEVDIPDELTLSTDTP
jgi:hypothetical protein